MVDKTEMLELLERARSSIPEDVDLFNRIRPEVQRVADSGNPYFQEVMGAAALEIDKDHGKAYRYLKLAADAGVSSAQRGVGYLLTEGLGCEKDLEMAAALFRMAADSGDVVAKFNLGGMYLRGEGVPDSEEKGIRLLEEASIEGLDDASVQLADVKASVEDYAGAREILERIVPEGDVPSRSAKNLATMCYQGLGGPVDKVKALGSCLRMAELGDRDGLGYGKTIAAELTTDEVRKAASWAKVDDWYEGFLAYASDASGQA
ncbi:tetratricopeptide repeat protein [Streptomyces olivochromogenes]|uniref:tetratricopeptide repeat protein n=1 Tax=Streptomyces olivochromogenes TaxID=1963 RepID=UPI0036DEA8C3